MIKSLAILAIIFLSLGQSVDIEVEQPDGTTEIVTMVNDNGDIHLIQWGKWSPWWTIKQEYITCTWHMVTFGGGITVTTNNYTYILEKGMNNNIYPSHDMYVWNIIVNGYMPWRTACRERIVYSYVFNGNVWTSYLHYGAPYSIYAFEPCTVTL